MKLAFWKRKKNLQAENNFSVNISPKPLIYDEVGIKYPISFASHKIDADFYWQSLEEEEIAYCLDDMYILPWDELFQILEDPQHKNVISLLNLPKSISLNPIIKSEGGLSDSNFKIILDGWSSNNIKVKGSTQRIGAVLKFDGKQCLLNKESYKLVELIKDFSRVQFKNKEVNQKYWAKIRNSANKADANLDDFLKKTIVLVPEKLQLLLRKNLISNESIVEVQPEFNEAPQNWINTFDQYNQVQDQYTVSLPDGGIAHIIIDSQVKNILGEIKKMPNRRVSGERAQAFIHNPFSQLGDDAKDIISPDSFEKAKELAEIYNYNLNIEKKYNEIKHYTSATLELSPNSEIERPNVFLELANIEQTLFFIRAYEKESPFFVWAGYEIQRTICLNNEINDLKADLENITKYNNEIQTQKVLDLSNYSGRVIGIGQAESLNAETIQKNSGDSEWLPHLIEQQTLPNHGELISNLKQCIQLAEENDLSEVIEPTTSEILSLDQARLRLNELENAQIQDKKDPSKNEDTIKKKKDTLLIANNIDAADFTKKRSDQLEFSEASFIKSKLPNSFRASEFSLKDHQLYGISWLQHLHQFAPKHIGGCLLADDMGLGKTLQLLCFIAEYLESSLNPKPVLVVAPVSLLENWEAEASKFFNANFPKILSLYGENLKERKIPKHLISLQLKENHGITNLLEDNWRGNAKIILTTYETMRDLEFSLAREDWSIMICDEAQKIKVPSAMVTKAAKAQKADFKIACTGTPVENSLTDLWCLFDFIQENLLGSLSEFGKNYRKQIENVESSDESALVELRRLIAPQVLRRMKHDIAALPPKTEKVDQKKIPISNLQRSLYKDLSKKYQKTESNEAMLGALHEMRMICAHPILLQPLASLNDSPKVHWLFAILEEIKQRNEKVIIFTEFRDIQIFLMRILMERFGLNVATVNGDSNTNSKKGPTRQKIIDKFQEKIGFNIIILSTTAVGFGVNIQKANHVIHYTRSWNPAKEDQATDRAYRIGQEKEVFVYYPTVYAEDFDTFEYKLDKLLSSKRALADDMLKPNGDVTKELLKTTY